MMFRKSRQLHGGPVLGNRPFIFECFEIGFLESGIHELRLLSLSISLFHYFTISLFHKAGTIDKQGKSHGISSDCLEGKEDHRVL